MIELKNVTKYYKTNKKRHYIFKNLNLKIKELQKIAILGPNGAGKSTFLRMISGIEPPNKGVVSRSFNVSWQIGKQSHNNQLMTGRENAYFICRLLCNSAKERKKKISFIHEFCELGDYFDMPIHCYSTGMKSKLNISLSLAFNFDYYIVDEGFLGGDKAFKDKSAEAFNKKLIDSGLIIVSHDMNIIRQHCDKAILIKNHQCECYDDLEQAISDYENSL